MDIFYIVIAGIWGITAVANGITSGIWISNKKYGAASFFGVVALLSISLVVLYSIIATGAWS